MKRPSMMLSKYRKKKKRDSPDSAGSEQSSADNNSKYSKPSIRSKENKEFEEELGKDLGAAKFIGNVPIDPNSDKQQHQNDPIIPRLDYNVNSLNRKKRKYNRYWDEIPNDDLPVIPKSKRPKKAKYRNV